MVASVVEKPGLIEEEAELDFKNKKMGFNGFKSTTGVDDYQGFVIDLVLGFLLMFMGMRN